MSTPAGKPGGGAADAAAEERRKGDRRSGTDRRDGDDRRTGISVSRSFRRPSFFDHPGWVAGTIAVGILLGIGVMSITDWAGARKKSGAIEMRIVPQPESSP